MGELKPRSDSHSSSWDKRGETSHRRDMKTREIPSLLVLRGRMGGRIWKPEHLLGGGKAVVSEKKPLHSEVFGGVGGGCFFRGWCIYGGEERACKGIVTRMDCVKKNHVSHQRYSNGPSQQVNSLPYYLRSRTMVTNVRVVQGGGGGLNEVSNS